jgi:hypothetical protein
MNEVFLEKIRAKYERLMAERRREKDPRRRWTMIYDIGTQIQAYEKFGGEPGLLTFPEPRRKRKRVKRAPSKSPPPTRVASPAFESPATSLNATLSFLSVLQGLD